MRPRSDPRRDAESRFETNAAVALWPVHLQDAQRALHRLRGRLLDHPSRARSERVPGPSEREEEGREEEGEREREVEDDTDDEDAGLKKKKKKTPTPQPLSPSLYVKSHTKCCAVSI